MAKGHKDKVAVITGAANGIGQAFAKRLAEDGVHVAVVDVADGKDTVKLVEAVGRQAIYIKCDVSSEQSVAAMAKQVNARFSHVDIVVNCAGIFPQKEFADMTFADWRKVLSTNLDGTFLVSAAFVPGMRARKWGRVVNMATERRLKATEVPPGMFLGDMTNFVIDLTMPLPFLVGLLNSALLNWRIKITSTNNYLSAAEIEALPILRLALSASTPEIGELTDKCLGEIDSRQGDTITENLKLVRATLRDYGVGSGADLIASVIEKLTTRILNDCRTSSRGPAVNRQKLLDALVLELYGAGDYAEIIDKE